MQVEIIDDSNREMVRRKTERYLNQGWQKRGEVRAFESFIPYEIKIKKHHRSVVYYQELVKREEMAQ